MIVQILITVAVIIVTYFLTKWHTKKYWEERIQDERRDAIKRSRSVLTGQFIEQLATYLPGFAYSPTECRFIGKPIDFIVFKGSDARKIEEVVFVEVKSGKSSLSAVERSLRDAIKSKKVKWEEFRFDSQHSIEDTV